MALGKRLETARLARKMSQSDLAVKVNTLLSEDEKQLTQQNINALESRDSNKTEHAYYMAIALDVSLVWLLTGRGSMEVSKDATISALLPGLDVTNLEKLSAEDRAFLAGKIDSEVEKALARSATGASSGKGLPPQPVHAPMSAHS